jgi:transglutaminase-like putative cysteine protease
MRVKIAHRTSYAYDAPASQVVQALRLTPRDHEAQHVRSWRIDIDVDGYLRAGTDPYGNALHMFYADGPLAAITITVSGEVDISDSAGLVRGAVEPLDPQVFLRPTPLTTPDRGLADLAARCAQPNTVDALHALMLDIHGHMTFDTDATHAATTAASALAAGRGVCQDFAHMFITAARLMGVPARYVSGHLARDETHPQEAAHAWAEALVPDLGWVAFDPANGVCATERHVRIAVGADYLAAAPVRGARRGGGVETLAVEVHAADARLQSQSQGQGFGQSQSQSQN